MSKSGHRKLKSGSDKGARDRLLDAAEELFGERGYEGTSVRDIAAALNEDDRVKFLRAGIRPERLDGQLVAVQRRCLGPWHADPNPLHPQCIPGNVPHAVERVFHGRFP